ncbi:MAG: nitroreductase family protein [Desulfosarcinaceae bacterium]|nr:nitroreductase family protein [Desulfosarcinaceae bacterium]
MTASDENPRVPEVAIDEMFTDRWSPRGFDDQPLSDEQIRQLFEAARWAPSCFNEQPWRFFYAVSEADRKAYLSALVPRNQLWAKRAPLLLFVLARRAFGQSGRENRHAPFDAGAAWLCLAFQARKMGLYAHAMAGFNQRRAYAVLGVSETEFHIMAAVAVGHKGSADHLPEEMQAIEQPNTRRPLSDLVFEGSVPGEDEVDVLS